MTKQSREFSHGYNSGYYAGIEAARAQLEKNQDDLVAFAHAHLELILSRKEGYVRLGLGTDGTIWARYKWTAGAYPDHYTFGSGVSLGLALAQMCERVDECNAGKRKPTRDTGYKRR